MIRPADPAAALRVCAGLPARGLAVMMIGLLASACGEDPEDTYLRLCLAASTVDLQRASCRCMGAEYAAILEENEYAAMVVLMEKAAASTAPAEDGADPMTTFVEPNPEASTLVVSALAKMDQLHRTGACGYGRSAPAH